MNRFKKQCETSDNHKEPELRTRYYKANFQQVFQTVEKILGTDPSVTVVSISSEHGEISAETHDGIPAFLVVTVITLRPYETAVDILLSSEKFYIAGAYPIIKNKVSDLYSKLGESLPAAGSGKYGN
ncbi:hypothetical protein [Mesobacillus zeae]|uniref:Cytosolic protein n=1 Tax=Mesobacillus zeae TaxID=1917180 RepID=A0A398B0E8_9BACI|nr:hypothetical protein [Mesobacillus zeae]RID83181.1 hypothetical protein D1970_16820 [Mesobacillus zeae]